FRGTGTSEVAGNAAGYARLRAEKGEGRTLFFSVRRGAGKPECFFFGEGRPEEARSRGTGIEALRKLVVAGMADEKEVFGCARQAAEGLDILYGNYPEEERLAQEYRRGMASVLDCLQRHYALIVCDAGSEEDWLGGLVLKRAAMVVRGAEQNIWRLQELLSGRPARKGEALSFYLFGRYDSDSKYNLYNLRRRFGGLTCRNSAGIPHCTQVWDACMDGVLAAEWRRWSKAAASKELKNYIRALRSFDREVCRRL
ncbi:MAG: hypothetical protein K2N94_10900, partial [Lachnospiraceae bacterium]|nr:hypothetical protein [Lachnospiraceae bacterium]